MYWANFFHIYQPPNWSPRIIKKVARESYRPVVNILKNNKDIKITLNVSGSLTEQLVELGLSSIVADIKKLALRNQIELVGTAMYHPILPLLPKKEIIRQITLNDKINKKYFGKAYQPRGFFAPEMSCSNQLLKTISSLGFKWIIIDEIAAKGKLRKLNFDQLYKHQGSNLDIIFRNRFVSDYFSFRSQSNNIKEFQDEIIVDGRSNHHLITAMDGENMGHHRPGMDKYWKKCVTVKGIRPSTISELIKKYKKRTKINIKSSSWSSREEELKNKIPYVLWNDPTNTIHSLQWKLLNKTTKLVNTNKSHPKYSIARELLDRRVASDQFWWASAKPWWSNKIVIKKTKELNKISKLLLTKPTEFNKLADKIITTANNWQETNKFLTITNKYLPADKNDNTRIIGGKIIK